MSTYLPLLIEMVMATRYILRISVWLGLVLSHPSRWLLISRKCLPLNCYCLINIVGASATQQQIYRAICADFNHCHCRNTVKVEVNYHF